MWQPSVIMLCYIVASKKKWTFQNNSDYYLVFSIFDCSVCVGTCISYPQIPTKTVRQVSSFIVNNKCMGFISGNVAYISTTKVKYIRTNTWWSVRAVIACVMAWCSYCYHHAVGYCPITTWPEVFYYSFLTANCWSIFFKENYCIGMFNAVECLLNKLYPANT